MYLIENPVLQRELLVNLRMSRAFALQGLYVVLLGAVVWLSWPREQHYDIASPETGQRLFNTFFVGQFVLVALMSPSFAAGAISGEKERRTYEMLLASPLRPMAVLVGKLLSSMCYLGLLIFSSIPLVVLCYPLGGFGLSEIAIAYLALLVAAGTFGLVSLACSSYFRHTAAALVVSYLAILPLALITLWVWGLLRRQSEAAQLYTSLFVFLPLCAGLWAVLIVQIRRRLLHPPDVGSEGKEVADEIEEHRNTVGLVIQRDQFPDRLFAPAKRHDLLADGANPVLDKELRSEIFSQGTLMLRVVIQVSMLLAIPLMAVFLFFQPEQVAYYVGYVVVFNMLVGPVFTASLITGERERGTLELLLTTVLEPAQILGAKLLSGLRVSTVLTLFLVWPMLLAYLFVTELQRNFWTLGLFLAIILVTCLATAAIGLFCSVMFRRTVVALIVAYLLVLILFGGPVAAKPLLQITPLTDVQIEQAMISSPISAALSVPLRMERSLRPVHTGAAFPVYAYYLGLYPPLCGVLWGVMLAVFRRRWQTI